MGRAGLGRRGALPRLRLPGERKVERETSLKSYLQDRAHRGASKQFAFGAHPKYPDNGFPVLSALDLRRLGFSPGGHHDNLGVWGNHLLESLDDVRSRDLHQLKTTHRPPAPRPPPGALAARASSRGRGRRLRKPAPGSPPRSAINHLARAPRAPPRVLCPAGWRRRAAPREPGYASPRRPSDPAPCPPSFGAAKAFFPQLRSLQKANESDAGFGAPSLRDRGRPAASL